MVKTWVDKAVCTKKNKVEMGVCLLFNSDNTEGLIRNIRVVLLEQNYDAAEWNWWTLQTASDINLWWQRFLTVVIQRDCHSEVICVSLLILTWPALIHCPLWLFWINNMLIGYEVELEGRWEGGRGVKSSWAILWKGRCLWVQFIWVHETTLLVTEN